MYCKYKLSWWKLMFDGDILYSLGQPNNYTESKELKERRQNIHVPLANAHTYHAVIEKKKEKEIPKASV